MSQDYSRPPVLTASVHDVRYFAALLRGVNFFNRATVLISEHGITITVEEARTLVGMAFIFSEIFDEFSFHPEAPPPARIREQPGRASKVGHEKGKGEQNTALSSETESDVEDNVAKDSDWRNTEDQQLGDDRMNKDDDDEDEVNNAAFEIPLNTLIECLNVFGTAGPSTISSTGPGRAGGRRREWQRANEHNDDSDNEHGAGDRNRGDLDAYFAAAAGGLQKRTSMRMTYFGAGYPLTLIIAEDASGPTTTCEITTFDPEPHLELAFDNAKIALKIILKSSWLRDALSELDPSCEKLTFIGNPSVTSGVGADGETNRPRQATAYPLRPMLRIQATGTFGSTEMDYPNDREVLETFECLRNVSFSYRLGHISRTLRALQSSTKTSLRIDDDGLLSLQFLMPSRKPGSTKDGFIEFRCLPLDDD